MAAERAIDEGRPGEETVPPGLEDLVPIAAVVGAGCEPCAARMVERALQHGSSKPLVRRTLGILAEVSAAGCFAAAVGPEIVDRMNRSLRAGRRALDGHESPREGPSSSG
jgi:alkylhydroperoxidase/carboxymuconolactone decarboxylase family protein YurZ